MTHENSLLRRHPVVMVFLLLAFILLFAETALRIAFAIKRYPVGKLAPAWLPFIPVDSLEVWDSFHTNDNGIYVATREYWIQRGWEINSEGLRGKEFVVDTSDEPKPSILFIGDSFTWGARAIPQDSCFVDLLGRDSSRICYNGGMPGTDPAQYLQVAKVYVPRLHPQVTIVIFNLTNDLMDTVRPIVPNRNLYFQTNAGWLPVVHNGQHFDSAREAYLFVKDKYSSRSTFESLLLNTAIGTAILTLPLRMEEYADAWSRKNSTVTNNYLRQIRDVSEQSNSTFLMFVIPQMTDLNENFNRNPLHYVKSEYPRLLGGMEDCSFVFPFKPDHFHPMPDGHLNNAGHLFAAHFIEEKLQEAVFTDK